jgi:hypothetical protein
MLSYTDPNDWYTPSQTKEQTFMPPFPSMLAQSHIIYASLIQAKAEHYAQKEKRKTRTEYNCKNKLLHLADNLVCLAQALDHLQALLASADCVVALLEQIVEFLCAVHLLQKLALHLFL